MEETYQKFLELLSIIMDADGNWREKKANLLAECGEGDESNLQELACWFTPNEPEGIDEGSAA